MPSMNRFLYNIFLHTLVAPFLAVYFFPRVIFEGKYRRSIRGKFGKLPADFKPERLRRPCIWFHAVSVGEVVAVKPLVKAVKDRLPGASIVVSTGTETGQDKARDSIPEADGFLYLPLDFPAFIDRVVDKVRPNLFVLMETELWPNLIHSLNRCGAAVALANGRISDRSFPRYRRLRPFFSPTLQKIDLYLMTSELDGERIAAMGARSSRIHITGNTKFDAALGNVPGDAQAAVRGMLDLDASVNVLVAGSTHPGEHEIILDAYSMLRAKFPELILILVPRHVEKTHLILSSIRDRGLSPPFLRTSVDEGQRRDGRRIVIIDRTGELFRVFSVASVVFMGGSLVPKGGQNILEPAAWGKMVLFGPSMEDFREARDILVGVEAGIEVTGVTDLVSGIDDILSHPERFTRRAERGRAEILRHVGSAATNAGLLVRLLETT